MVGSVALMVGCGKDSPKTNRDASPHEVVAAWITALNDHDTAAARKLLSADEARNVESQVDSWLRNVKRIDNVKFVGDREPSNPTYESFVEVSVTFDLEQIKESSMMNGDTVWGYQLGRHSPDEPWLIVGQGAG
ncbi:MAG: hypothetical protein QOF21_1805 [Actinomycetota bacterium]|jgi:hypothetical protein